MNKLRSKRRSFSSPNQLLYIQTVINNRWKEVRLAAEARHEPEHKALINEPNVLLASSEALVTTPLISYSK